MSSTFLKWAGNKAKLIQQISPYIPEEFGDYYEPFLGSGAMFFYLCSKGLIKNKAFLSDANTDLINCFDQVKIDHKLLSLMLSPMAANHSKDYYYSVRSVEPSVPSAKAARFIYLNKTAFNGVYRVNKSGQFNVPFGYYEKPAIHQPSVLKTCSSYLQSAEIKSCNYSLSLKGVKPGDFVYIDPPYHGCFSTYTVSPFKEKQHRELASVFYHLVSLGAKVLLSNSDTEFVRDLYGNYQIVPIYRSGAINCCPDKRGKVQELLVLGNIEVQNND